MLTYRTATAEDEASIAEGIAADPDHAGRVKPEFFSTPPVAAECFLVSDEVGPLFFIRAENVLRLHLQACPQSGRRLPKGLDEFAARIKNDARGKYRQIIFDSVAKPLIRFLSRRGYVASPNEYVTDID